MGDVGERGKECFCGHGMHLHDPEAVPELCMLCGDAERCDVFSVATPAGQGVPDALEREWRANRAPGTTWMLRPLGTYPNGEVRTAAEDRVEVTFYDGAAFGRGFSLTRRDARLLAKRINQCLDGTAKR